MKLNFLWLFVCLFGLGCRRGHGRHQKFLPFMLGTPLLKLGTLREEITLKLFRLNLVLALKLSHNPMQRTFVLFNCQTVSAKRQNNFLYLIT